MICPRCNRETPDGVPNCVHCGFVFALGAAAGQRPPQQPQQPPRQPQQPQRPPQQPQRPPQQPQQPPRQPQQPQQPQQPPRQPQQAPMQPQQPPKPPVGAYAPAAASAAAKGGMSAGAIIGIIVGVLAALAVIAGIIIVIIGSSGSSTSSGGSIDIETTTAAQTQEATTAAAEETTTSSKTNALADVLEGNKYVLLGFINGTYGEEYYDITFKSGKASLYEVAGPSENTYTSKYSIDGENVTAVFDTEWQHMVFTFSQPEETDLIQYVVDSKYNNDGYEYSNTDFLLLASDYETDEMMDYVTELDCKRFCSDYLNSVFKCGDGSQSININALSADSNWMEGGIASSYGYYNISGRTINGTLAYFTIESDNDKEYYNFYIYDRGDEYQGIIIDNYSDVIYETWQLNENTGE